MKRIYLLKNVFSEKRETYCKGQYLYLSRSRVPRLHFETRTRPNDDEVVFTSDELPEPFEKVNESLTKIAEMSTRPSLKERKCIADLLLTVAFFVLHSSDIFIVIVPAKGIVKKIKKEQGDDRFHMKNKT